MNNFDFRQGFNEDIITLEEIRLKSIANCSTYNSKQIAIWQQSIPNWLELIPDTIVCIINHRIAGFVIANSLTLDYLYVDPDFQNLGIANQLVAFVELPRIKCDCNPYSERILKRRGWDFLEYNVKEKDGVLFKNKWYIFQK